MTDMNTDGCSPIDALKRAKAEFDRAQVMYHLSNGISLLLFFSRITLFFLFLLFCDLS